MRGIVALALLLGAQPALSATWSYDFSGTLADHFEHFESTSAASTVTQADGRLQFETRPGSQAPRETSETYFFLDASPGTTFDWSVRVDVVVPWSLNEQTPRGNGNNAWAAASLIAFVADETGQPTKGFTVALEADSFTIRPTGSMYYSGAFDLVTGIDFAERERATSDSAATLGLAFDAVGQTITTSVPGGALLAYDIGAWGLTSTSIFRVGVAFDTRNMAVPAGQSMTMDNFVLTAVPEPAIYLELLAGLGLMVVGVRRRGRGTP